VPADVMENAHMLSYSSEVKHRGAKQIAAHLAVFDMLLFTATMLYGKSKWWSLQRTVRFLLRHKRNSERLKTMTRVVDGEGAVPHHCVFSGGKRGSDVSLSIKRCSEAIEGRLGDVRPWGFTHCTLCLWASALFECL